MTDETHKTGIFVRFERDGKWQNIDIANLSADEFERFLVSQGASRCDIWARGLHKWIIEHVDFSHPVQ